MDKKQAVAAGAGFRYARYVAWWLLLAIMLIVLTDIAWIAHRRNIPISRQVTGIVTPLTPGGEVDYSAATDELFGKNVTPTNNAAIGLIEALVTQKRGMRPLNRALLSELHVRTSVLGNVGLIHYQAFVKSSAKSAARLRSLKARDYRHWYDWDYAKPWSVRQYPWIAAWLVANGSVLDRVVRASHRHRLWLSAPAGGGEAISLHQMMQNAAMLCSPVVRAGNELVGLAMLELNRHQISRCEKDLRSVRRLGSLLHQEPFLFDRVCGDTLQTNAARGEIALAGSGLLGAADAMTLAKPTAQERWEVSLATCLNTGVRWCTLCQLRSIAGDWLNGKAGRMSKVPTRYLFLPPDFAQQMQLANAWSTLYVRAMRWPNPAARIAAVMHVCSQRDKAEMAEETLYPWTAVGISPHVFLPFLDDLQAANYRRLARIAIALVAYSDSHRQFPHSLAGLLHGYLSTLPKDAFTGKLFYYKTSGQRCLLKGPNLYPRRWMQKSQGLGNRILTVRLGAIPVRATGVSVRGGPESSEASP